MDFLNFGNKGLSSYSFKTPEQLEAERKKREEEEAKKQKEKTPIDTLKKSNSNNEFRLNQVGVDTTKVHDDRNGFEKKLNLEKDQNWLFDTFELLDRVGQGSRNVLKHKITDTKDTIKEIKKDGLEFRDIAKLAPQKSSLKTKKEDATHFIDGLMGKEKTKGHDLLDEVGYHAPGKDANFGKKAAHFTASLATEVATDPLTYTGLGLITKPLGKAITKTGNATGKAIQSGANSAIGQTIKADKALDFTTDKLGQVKDGIGNALKYNYFNKNAHNPTRYDEIGLNGQVGTPENFFNQKEAIFNQNKYELGEASDTIYETAKKHGEGDLVMREMEKPLKNEVKIDELIDELNTNGYKTLTGTSPELQSVIKAINEGASKTPQGRIVQESVDDELAFLERTKQEELARKNEVAHQNETAIPDEILHEIDHTYAKEADTVKKRGDDYLENLEIVEKKSPSDKPYYQITKKETMEKEILGDPLEVAAKSGKEFVEKYMANKSIHELTALKAKPELVGEMERIVNNLAKGGSNIKAVEHADEIIKTTKSMFGDNVKILTDGKITWIKPNNALEKKLKQDFRHQNKVDQLLLREKETPGSLTDQEKALVEKELPNKYPDIETTVEIPRPEREYIDWLRDPEKNHLLDAAEKLTGLNKDLLYRINKELDIDIADIEGYARHFLSSEEKKRTKVANLSGRDFFGGDPNVVKQRQFKGQSAEDVNDIKGRKFFETNAYLSTAAGQQKLLDFMMKEKVKKLAFEEYAVKASEMTDLPKGFVKLRPSDYEFSKINKGLDAKNEVYYVPDYVAREIRALGKKNADEGTNAALKAYDAFTSFFKKAALFSVGFHVRTVSGNAANMYIAGMSPKDVSIGMTKAMKEIRDVQKLIKKSRTSTLDDFEKQKIRDYDLFKQQGMKEGSRYTNEFSMDGYIAMEKKLNDLNKALTRKAARKLNPAEWAEMSRQFGTYVDEIARFTTWKWAKNNPQKAFKGEQLTKYQNALKDADGWKAKEQVKAQYAANKVRETLFDYSHLTEFEKSTARRIIPFYTFLKKNIEFQSKNLIENPTRMTNIDRASRISLEENEMEKGDLLPWLQDTIPFGIGDNQFLNLNLPTADIGKITDPAKLLSESANPLVKMPFELGSGKNFFMGTDIDTGTDYEYHVPLKKEPLKLDPKLGYFIDQFGAIRNVSKNTEEYRNKEYDQLFSGNVIRDHDQEKADLSREYNKKDDLEKLMNRFKQENGTSLPTVSDLKSVGIYRPEDIEEPEPPKQDFALDFNNSTPFGNLLTGDARTQAIGEFDLMKEWAKMTDEERMQYEQALQQQNELRALLARLGSGGMTV